MSKIRCNTCVGAGYVLGGGMMKVTCEECDGTGKVYDKQKSYDEAVEKIQLLEPGMSKQDAQKIFDDELNKIEVSDGKSKKK